LRALARRDELEQAMDAELAHHLESLTRDLELAGYGRKEAGRRARIALGGTMTHKEEMRASLGLTWWDELRADARYGLRILRKSPAFTAIAVVSLALAIGANTTIFSLAKSTIYDRLRVPHPEQLRMVRVCTTHHSAVRSMWGNFGPNPDGSGQIASIVSYPVYQQLQAHNRVLGDLLAYQDDSMNATMASNAERVAVTLISGNYFDVLGVRPQLGRSIAPTDEAEPGASPVVMISDSLWRRVYASSPGVIGQSITLNQVAVTIIGVTPRGFTGVKNTQDGVDLYLPVTMQPVVDPKGQNGDLLNDGSFWWLQVVGRHRNGVSDLQAEAQLNVELNAAARATMTVKAGRTIPRLILTDGSRGLAFTAEMFRKPVSVLMTMTGLVLLLACANIANLLLARGAQRQREMSVRLALGAGRARVLRQMLTESLLLAAMGGIFGLLLGYMARNAIPRLMMSPWERGSIEVPVDWGVFAFVALITMLTGVLFGLAPAWLASRSEVSTTLKQSGQTTTRQRKGLSGKAIVAFQIALSTLLVVGACLFMRTLWALQHVDVGFRTDHLLLFGVTPPEHRYGKGKDAALHQQLEAKFAAIPGVEGVGPGWMAYLSGSISNSAFIPEGVTPKPDVDTAENMNAVGNQFFQTLAIPMIAGRSFGPEDTATSEKVAIINQTLAKKRFEGVDPVGRRFRMDDEKPQWIRIVGICRDTRYSGMRENPPAQFFLPYVQQEEVGGMTYAVRTHVDPASLTPALRKVLQQVDRDLPLEDVRTQQQQIEENTQTERTFAALTAGFGVLALLLAMVGIYGIMAYTVANRRTEMGIRMALGAQPGQLRGMVLRESTVLAAVGIVAGAGAALGLTRLVRTMLYGIEPNDPLSLLCGVAVLLAVALVASWIPALRASRVQPMEALRHE
jgi:predicted permease